jgi:hypothetical protein
MSAITPFTKIAARFGLLLLVPALAFARTDLKPMMASTCEDLGTTRGVECVKLQRILENDNVAMDRNGADLCALIWRWGSKGAALPDVGDLVLSCFRQIANLRVSEEVKNTCNGPISDIQGSYNSIETVRDKTTRMMECIGKLGIPMNARKSKPQ